MKSTSNFLFPGNTGDKGTACCWLKKCPTFPGRMTPISNKLHEKKEQEGGEETGKERGRSLLKN